MSVFVLDSKTKDNKIVLLNGINVLIFSKEQAIIWNY